MPRIEESVKIKRPVEEVFAFTTEAKSWPRWQATILEAEQTSPGPVNVGTAFKGVIHMMGGRMKWTAVATEYEPPRRFGKEITSGPVTTKQHNTYEPAEAGTRFTIAYQVKVGGLMTPLSPLVASAMRKALRQALQNLKAVLETQA
jgi:ligand-binding SRPBCC domain-containing protein